MSGIVKPHKRSVYRDNIVTVEPHKVLEFCYASYYNAPLEDPVMRLKYASIVSVLYLAALRNNEALVLTKDQFSFDRTPAGSPVLVVNNIAVEKVQGRFRNCPIPLEDPIAKPLLKYLPTVKEFLFDFTDRTVRNVVYRATGGEGWPHWLRSQRVSFLSSYLSDAEIDAFAGWGSLKPEKPREFYTHRAWSNYADKVVLASKQYWDAKEMDPFIAAWYRSL